MVAQKSSRKSTAGKKTEDLDGFRTTIFLTQGQRKALGHLAVEKGTTKSDIIRQAIVAILEQHRELLKKWE